MTSIIRDWLASVNIEYNRDEKLEDIFSNGYLIGKLLCNLEIGGLTEELFSTQFVNDVSIEAITTNYKLTALYLCEGGVNMKPKLLQDIASNVSGAIHRFIYDLKCFIESQSKERDTNIAVGISGLNEGTSSFKAPPRISSPTRIRKYAYEDMLKRDVELKIRKLATEKFHKRSELKWQKYRDHRSEIEKTAKSEQEFEKQLKNERVAQRHDVLVHTLKENHLKREEIDTFSKQKWIKNQKTKKQRICEKKHFQQTQSLKQVQKENVDRQNASNQICQSLDEFEMILSKTQKIQKNENQEIKASELQKNNEEKTETKEEDESDENAVTHLEKLRNKLPNKTISMKETEKYLKQIKVNVNKQKQECIDREQRRKQLISDEIETNKEKEKLDRKTEIKAIINDKNNRFENKIKSIKLHKQIFKQNAKLFAEKEHERKAKDEQIKLKRDRKHFEIKTIEFKTKLSIENRKLNALKLKETQYGHVQNINYCKQLVEKMVGITYKSVLYRQLSQEENVPTQLWSEWIQLLNNNNNNNNLHILSNIDINAKHEELDKELNQILLKEKQCHSEIIRIKNGLIECMDINGEINKNLINQTELNNYLNAKGIWKYDSDVTEPTTDNLGGIIEEIGAISRGEELKHEKIIPDVPICIAFIGKPYVGKTTQAQQIADRYALQVIEPQKCIEAAMQSFDAHSEVFATENELSRQQQIGERLRSVLQDGKGVDDELYIDAIFDAILSGKDEQKVNGWILDGFPNRKSQAELLENKLSGYVVAAPTKQKKSKIAPPPEKDASESETIPSGLDFVFYLDVEGNDETDDIDTVLLSRGEGRLIDEESGRVYHITANPPPHDQCIKERLRSGSVEENGAGLAEHIKAWNDRKEELANWFNTFGIWRELNCNQDRKTLTLSLIEIIRQQIQIKKEKENEEQKLELNKNEETAENVPDNNQNENENEIEEETEEKEAENNKLSDEEIYGELHSFWCNFEESYIDNILSTFELLRHGRRRVLAYLASTREYFYNFLRAKDGKQLIIDQFQNEFNNNTDFDERCNDDTKDELKQQSKELSFKLFQYSMEKKNESLKELDNIKKSVWLKKENNILLQTMINVIQYELNRYIATIRVIKDYFSLKNGQKMCDKPVQQIDLFTIIKPQNKKLENENDKLQNAIDMALQYIVKDNPENEAEGQLINDENTRLKIRLLRLNKILNFHLRDVSQRHNNLLQKMDQWIGLRINSENEAIDSLVQHIEQCIGNECPLHYKLILDGQNFLIDQDVIVCPMPNPIQKTSTKHQFAIAFTAKQIKQFIKLFQSQTQNVSGVIEYKTMYGILEKLSNDIDVDNEPILPRLWCNNLNDHKIDLLLSSVVIIGLDEYVNWKLFVVSLMFHTLSVISNTIIIPSLDTLFELKQAFNAKDINNSATLNEKEFGGVLLWFDKTANNVWQHILFNLFKSESDGDEISYNELLYHLCFNDESHFGFEKIVSLMENLNVIQDTTNITNAHLRSMQMRGIPNIENANDMSQIFNSDQQLTINAIKQNDQMLKYFNLINIQQILT